MIAVAVLAAGRGVRFGGNVPKPLIGLGGRPLVAHALDAARGAHAARTLLVVADDSVAAVAGPGVEVLRNEAPERGIASSLQVAIRALQPDARVDAVVVGLADQPLVGAAAYRRLAAASASLAYATYGGERGNPVRIGRDHWDAALALTGDEGARVLFREYPAEAVPCDDTGSPADIDTPADLATVESRWRSQTASE